jgi:tryptophan synthase alpha chain
LATTSSDRAGTLSPLGRRLESLRSAGRSALIPYVTAGHPSPGDTLALLQGLESAGADAIEVGVPFSDPMADGPIIQASSQRALEHGVTFDTVLELVSRAKLGIPVVLFSYLNPIIAAGQDALERASQAGVHGVLVTDLPVGADPEREAWLGGGPLDFVRLVAPTTPAERMAQIAQHGSGFVYLISRLGVTGVHQDVASDLGSTIARLRSATSLPVCVGFGISRPEHAAAVARMADGVIVGSAIVRAAGEGVDAAVRLAGEMRRAMDAPAAG